MLVLDFINVGNGDSILVREMRAGKQHFAMLVDCGHDNLFRDDHPLPDMDRTKRVYAGDFLRQQGVTHLDILLITHFHRDHVGGLGRILEAVTVGKLVSAYIPPVGAPFLELGEDLPKAARNFLRFLNLYAQPLEQYGERIAQRLELSGEGTVTWQLTEELTMDILFGDPSLYPRQRAVCDGAFRGERSAYDFIHWAKCLNLASLRQRLYYHGKEIVLGGDVYAPMWETETARPCDVLKVPHHASLSSTTRKLLKLLRPKVAVVSVASHRPDERPHPYTISLLKEYAEELHFTDAIDLPGLVEPEYHASVHLELP